MNTFDKNMSDILNCEVISAEEDTSSNQLAVIQHEETKEDAVEIDADFARSQMYKIIQQGDGAIELIGNIAKETTHPRALEVMSQLLKTQSENIDKLLKIQKDKKDLQKDNPAAQQQTNINVEQAVFVGSTADLLKKVKHEQSSQ